MINNFLVRRALERQVVPAKEDVTSVKNLVIKLRGLSDAETLNNILEWQERNITYWRDLVWLDPDLHNSVAPTMVTTSRTAVNTSTTRFIVTPQYSVR
jgi:hypothetical protein